MVCWFKKKPVFSFIFRNTWKKSPTSNAAFRIFSTRIAQDVTTLLSFEASVNFAYLTIEIRIKFDSLMVSQY